MIWSGGKIIDLAAEDRTGVLLSQSQGINNRGQVVGWAAYDVDPGSPFWAFAFEQHRMMGLRTGKNVTDSGANAIDDAGDIVGDIKASGRPGHATFWQANAMTDLGQVGGRDRARSSACAINDHHQIAGWSTNTANQKRATLWTFRAS